MKKILMFATYTIANPQHGGQKRVRALYDAYKKSGSLEPEFCAIYFPLHYKDSWSGDIPVPKKYIPLLTQNPFTGDVIIGQLVYEDRSIRRRIADKITAFKPDIIEIEHPFLYIGLKEVLNEIGYTGKLIYSSHNIEYSMKEEMLESEGYSENKIAEVVSTIKDIEVEITREADLVYSVSEGDLKQMKAMKEGLNIVLARNGMEPAYFDSADVEYWRSYFANLGVDKVALFVGSAHPPNWTGYLQMVGSKIGFLKKNERIVMAGSIGEYFETYYSKNDVDSVVFKKRAMMTGRLSESRLNALIAFAHCVILPIIEGGGSNLKTAEALLSQKAIVGTSHAFRAFEKFVKYPTVSMSDDPHKFRELIAKRLREKPVSLTSQQRSSLMEVTWKYCLKNAVKEAESL